MKNAKLILLFVLAIALAALVLQNRATVEVHFLWMTAEMPGILLLFLTVAGGFALGILASLFVKRGK